MTRLLVLALCLVSLTPLRALAQGCITCRTERCKDKPTLRGAPWCGAGRDPLLPRQRTPSPETPRTQATPVRPAEAPIPSPEAQDRPLEAPAPPSVGPGSTPRQETPAAPAARTVPPPGDPQPSAPAPGRPPAVAPARAALTLTSGEAAVHRGRPLRAAGGVLLGLGLLAAGASVPLFVLDSRPSCEAADPVTMCPSLYDTRGGGIGLAVAGGVGVVTATVLLALDARRPRGR